MDVGGSTAPGRGDGAAAVWHAFRDRYVGLFTGKYNLLAVARINKDGSVLWNVMNVEDKRMNKQRVGELLYPKK